MKVSLFVATSLDGFIARGDGGLDWLAEFDDPDGVEDYGFKDFMDSVDMLLMGRHTFETVLSFGKWPYGNKPLAVLSSMPVAIPGHLTGSVEAMGGEPRELLDCLSARGVEHIYLDGGLAIQRFLAAGLVNQMIITTVPLLLGCGIPLFGPLEQDIRLRLVDSRSYPSGLVQSRYEVEI